MRGARGLCYGRCVHSCSPENPQGSAEREVARLFEPPRDFRAPFSRPFRERPPLVWRAPPRGADMEKRSTEHMFQKSIDSDCWLFLFEMGCIVRQRRNEVETRPSASSCTVGSARAAHARYRSQIALKIQWYPSYLAVVAFLKQSSCVFKATLITFALRECSATVTWLLFRSGSSSYRA